MTTDILITTAPNYGLGDFYSLDARDCRYFKSNSTTDQAKLQLHLACVHIIYIIYMAATFREAEMVTAFSSLGFSLKKTQTWDARTQPRVS